MLRTVGPCYPELRDGSIDAMVSHPNGSFDGANNVDKHFATVIDALRGEPGVTPPDAPGGRRFGSSALKVHGSIFCMVTRGHLVVKLPRDRVNALIAEGIGGSFDAGKGTPMKEWLTVLCNDEKTSLALAREALAFAGGQQER